jgi:uncharacterized membrane-anchored protein YhcB (DUF1043 family)
LRERLGMYVLGIAIGCVILGLIFTMRNQAARQQQAAQRPATPQQKSLHQ